MKKIIIVLFLLFNSLCLSKTKEFDVNLKTLNFITEKYKYNRELFNEEDYTEFTLYKAIVLNDFLVNKHADPQLKEFFCESQKSDLLKLLKWKIVITHSKFELSSNSISCKQEIDSALKSMETHLLNSNYVDAFTEYYKFLKSRKSDALTIKWSILNTNLYGRPDIEIAESLIDVQKQIGDKRKNFTGLWHISVIAAQNGSLKGLKNMMNLLDKKSLNYRFLSKIEKLWPNKQHKDTVSTTKKKTPLLRP